MSFQFTRREWERAVPLFPPELWRAWLGLGLGLEIHLFPAGLEERSDGGGDGRGGSEARWRWRWPPGSGGRRLGQVRAKESRCSLVEPDYRGGGFSGEELPETGKKDEAGQGAGGDTHWSSKNGVAEAWAATRACLGCSPALEMVLPSGRRADRRTSSVAVHFYSGEGRTFGC